MANVRVPIFDGADNRNVVGQLTLDEQAATRLIDGDWVLSYEYVRQDGSPRLLAVGLAPTEPATPSPVTRST